MKIDDFCLRELTENDLEMVLTWRNSDWVRAYMYTDHVITMDEHRAWFARMQEDPKSVYLVFEELGVPLGIVNFIQIDRENGKALWGFYLGPEHPPRGRGSIMEYLALDYAFETLKLRKLCGEVFAFNQHVLKLHRKFGFREEGCLRKHILKNGDYVDVIPISIFTDEWAACKDRLTAICFRGGN